MNLREFHAETLAQVVSGVKEAQDNAASHGALINPLVWGDERGGLLRTRSGQTVTIVGFDVAVSAVDAQDSRGGAGLLVRVLGIDVQEAARSESTSVNRVRFHVPVASPAADGLHNAGTRTR
jgi:hypothetical protein